MSKFQLILTAVFGIFIVGGVIIFSAYRGSSGEESVVTFWGSIPSSDFADIIDSTSLKDSKTLKVEYLERSEEEFDQEFIEALASGEGPDLFILPSDKIVKHSNKIFIIPYNVFSERQFKDLFIEGAEVYTNSKGVLALPIAVDPLVMYWNRNIFNQSLITKPPKYWDEFYNLASKISKKDGALNIEKSAVAFGEFSNITHAKQIISTLAMQGGTPITRKEDDGRVRSVFDYSFNQHIVPADAAVNFYTEFSNPSKQSYSWNRSLPSSQNYFLGGDLGLYFGFASEISEIQIKNPNLNFDVAVIPTSREDGTGINYGHFYAIAVTKSSKNLNAAFSVASILASEGAENISSVLGIPPVNRELLSKRQSDAYKSVFYESAIKSRSWLDPDPKETDSIFKNMIESITSGRVRTSEAVSRASREIDILLSK